MTPDVLPYTPATTDGLLCVAAESSGASSILFTFERQPFVDSYASSELVGAPAQTLSFHVGMPTSRFIKLQHYQSPANSESSLEVTLEAHVNNQEWLALSEASFEFWNNELDAIYDEL